jgi:hypothetical protein
MKNIATMERIAQKTVQTVDMVVGPEDGHNKSINTSELQHTPQTLSRFGCRPVPETR